MGNTYKHLVERPHAWRKQLYLRGKNMTVGQMVATMHANHWTAEQMADQIDVPEEQVREALSYFEAHKALIEQEFETEGRMLAEQGFALAPNQVRAPAR